MLLRIGLISMTQGTRKRNFGKAGEYTPVTACWHGQPRPHSNPATAAKPRPAKAAAARGGAEKTDEYHDPFSEMDYPRR